MKKVTKMMCLLIAVLMLVGTMAACGGEKDDGTKSTTGSVSSSTKEQSAAPAAELKKVDIKVLTGGDGDVPDADLVAQEINKVSEKELNINLKVLTIPWSDYIEKAKTMAAAGEEFDIFLSFVSEMQGNIARKQSIPLDGLLDKYGPAIKSAISPDDLKDTIVNGKLYGIPSIYPNVNVASIFIRKDLREKYQVPEIQDIDTFNQYLEAVAKNEKGIAPYTSIGGRTAMPMIKAFQKTEMDLYTYGDVNSAMVAIDWSKKPYKVVSNFTTEETKAGVEWASKAYKNGLIAKDILTTKDDLAAFASGKAAAFPSDTFNIVNVSAQLSKNIPGASLEEVKFNKDKPVVKVFKINNYASISGTSKNPERAMMFLNWIRESKDNYDLYMLGIKGKHWNPVGDDKYELPAGVDPSARPYNPSPWWTKQMNLDRSAVNENPVFLNSLQKITSQKYVRCDLIDFAVDNANFKTEQAQVSAVILEKWLPVINGVKGTEADYQAALSALDKAGLPKIISEIQKQIDDWSAKNGK